MDKNCVVYLEQMVAALQAQGVETQSHLQQLIATMNQLLPTMPLSSPESQVVTPPTMEPPKDHRPKPATPPKFSGERTKGLAFLNSCQTYIHLCPEEFRDDETKIVWAMSYMKSGRAKKWAA